jgi:hypothetical protein
VELKNIQYILVTFDVSKLEKSIVVIALHFPNIPAIFVTCEVSKFDKFTDVRAMQLSNILLIFVTPEVSKYSKPVILVKEVIPLNKYADEPLKLILLQIVTLVMLVT